MPEELLDDFAAIIGRTMGWPPMAGRVAGVLLLEDGPLTVQQLQERLGASAGSVSEMTRLLVDNGVVRRGKEPGTRHYLYEWRADAWTGCLQHQVRQNERLRELAHGARRHERALGEHQRRRLREMAEYYDFMVARMTAVLAEFRDPAQPDQGASARSSAR